MGGNVKFFKNLRRAGSKFSRGGIFKEGIKPLIMDALTGGAPVSGQGRYRFGKRRRYRRKSYKGRGIYTGQGLYLGRGAYSAGRNSLISSKSDTNIVPRFSKMTDDEYTIIARREYVSEIYGPPLTAQRATQPFVLQAYEINPGLERTFPWLSQIASNYEEYELLQLIFTFKSTTTESGNQLNGQVGTVIMTTNYNADAPVFRDKNVMMQYSGSASSRLTETLMHGVECNPRKLSGSIGNYVRSGPVVEGGDKKSYDHGTFQIAIANCTANLANQSLGELWVSYKIKLRKPKFYTSLGYAITKDVFRNNPLVTSGVTSSTKWGHNFLRGQQNSLGCRIQDSDSPAEGPTVITFPATFSGYIKVILTMQLAAGSIYSTFVNSVLGNVRKVADIYGNDAAVSTSPNDAIFYSTGERSIIVAHYQVAIATNGVDNQVLLGWTHDSGPHVLSECFLEIGEYNASNSYLNTNLGTSDAIVWIDTSRTLVIA